MKPLDRFRNDHIEVSEEQAERLQHCHRKSYPVQVNPPRDQDLPASLERFIRGIEEYQSQYLKLRNASPVVAFEIRRPVTDKLRFQFVAPTKRLERKIRNLLAEEIPGAEFIPGVDGLPVYEEETFGGGILTTGRSDWHPLKTGFDEPPVNALAALLHRHGMRDTKLVVQILLQPVIGRPVRRWMWRKSAYRHQSYLRKEKEKLWGSRKPTRREKRQADAIEAKAGSNRFYTCIRIAVIGAGEYTSSRVKELAGGFRVFESQETDQYIDTVTVKPFRESRLYSYAKAVSDRRFGRWSLRFQTSVPEAAAMVTLPSINQQNIPYSKP